MTRTTKPVLGRFCEVDLAAYFQEASGQARMAHTEDGRRVVSVDRPDTRSPAGSDAPVSTRERRLLTAAVFIPVVNRCHMMRGATDST